jgi:hypothetical protein
LESGSVCAEADAEAEEAVEDDARDKWEKVKFVLLAEDRVEACRILKTGWFVRRGMGRGGSRRRDNMVMGGTDQAEVES